jgi:ataxia telangiectasia mutated family protein
VPIRTYKVVPLSPTTGMVEWVHGCMAMGSFLMEAPWQAHVKYHPTDLQPLQARARLEAGHTAVKAARDAHKPIPYPDPRVVAMGQIMAEMRPVFHRFFIDFFGTAHQWKCARDAYTQSVAISSVVGYVAGIGDRHVNNIMVDTRSGEVVHIDFGVAFEQGRLLPTPEQVPARLTRDVVDGCGVLGTHGPFSDACEDSMRLLRDSKETIMTLLRVVLHDPLYRWNISPDRAVRIQAERDPGLDTGSVASSSTAKTTTTRQRGAAASSATTAPPSRTNTAAPASSVSKQGMGQAGGGAGAASGDVDASSSTMRALARVQAKLDGMDHADASGQPLGPRAQVVRMISDSQSINNWALMYPGWQPFL